MKKNVWILNHYATNMFEEKGGRHYNFSKNLKKKNYEPIVFCANTYHSKEKIEDLTGKKFLVKEDEHSTFVFVKATKYKGNGFSRIQNMISYSKNVGKAVRQYSKEQKKTPDIILASSVHPLTCVAGIFIAKRFKVPCIVEIRDLWPEAIVEYSNKLTKNHPLIKILYQGEKWIYTKADKLIFTMEGGKQYIQDQGWDKKIDLNKVYHINNGVDLEIFDYNKEHFTIEDEDLDNPNIFKIVYTGSIRRVNNLGMILDVAKEIKNPKIKILIWGNGDEVEELKQRILDEKIDNCCFKGGVDKKYVPYILSKADVNLATCAKSDIQRYGISQNKIFEYLAAGKPIISTQKDDKIFDNSYALSFDYDNIYGVKEAIIAMYEKEECERCNMGAEARKKSYEYDFKVLTEKLIQIIESDGY